MQTNFSLDQLARPDLKEMEAILRKCVHCGFCLPACPTYSILGDERDSPRGRIYLIKDLIESEGASVDAVAPHIDKCLSCLACTTVCPSGVDYRHYVDYARKQIEGLYRRPLGDKIFRKLLGRLISSPGLFRPALLWARYLKPFAGLTGRRFAPALGMAPKRVAANQILTGRHVYPAEVVKRQRVALLAGCAQQVLRPSINQSTIRVLNRLGCDVVVVNGEGCCGALVHHLGEESASRDRARALIKAWEQEQNQEGLDAIIVNTSGCGSHVKDFGHLLKDDDEWRAPAMRVASLTKDVSEIIDELGLPKRGAAGDGARVAYHAPCTLLHGQKIDTLPERLLEQAGFVVMPVKEKHFCCGSAGIYNLVQPEIADMLKERRQQTLQDMPVEFVATGNIGCQRQLQSGLETPVVHMIELLDWALGGSKPPLIK